MSKKKFTFGAVSPNVAMIKDNGEPMDTEEVVDKLNKLYEENEQLREKNKQIGYLKRDLFILINLIRDTPMEFNCDFEKIVERWE